LTSSPGIDKYQPLPKTYKRRYPFRLSVPSFIYPDKWSVNARMLGPHVDEVELLFFESRSEDCLPTREEIEALSQISKDFCLTYNIHLPTDISLAAADRAGQSEAIDALLRVMDLTSRLDPTSWTLHIPYDAPQAGGGDVTLWQVRARAGLERLLAHGIQPRRLAIENIDYPFAWVWDLVRDFDLSICMDAGHLLIGGESLAEFYREYADRITVIHLHGAKDGKDHQPPTSLSTPDAGAAVSILKDYTGTLSLEVFSYDYLEVSLEWLETRM